MIKELFVEVIDMVVINESLECVEEIMRLVLVFLIFIDVVLGILCWIVWVGWKDIVKIFYDVLFVQDKKFEFFIQLLYFVVEYGDVIFVEMVIEWIDDINVRDVWG